MVGIELANWNWKAIHQFVSERFGISLSRSGCLNYPRLYERQALPGYSPGFNGDEAIWGWVRKEATGNLCLESKAKVQERVDSFLAGLASRKEEVKRRARTVLQSKAEALVRDSLLASPHPANAHPTLALV